MIDTRIRLAVLITCHNRKTKTIECLNSLYKNDIPKSLMLDVFLVDDGSVDGSVESSWTS